MDEWMDQMQQNCRDASDEELAQKWHHVSEYEGPEAVRIVGNEMARRLGGDD